MQHKRNPAPTLGVGPEAATLGGSGMRIVRVISAVFLGLLLTAGAQSANAQNAAPKQTSQCEPGSACWNQLRANEEYQAERQRARQLRQYSIDQGRALRNQNVYPGYSDSSIPVFRPRGGIIVDPLKR